MIGCMESIKVFCIEYVRCEIMSLYRCNGVQYDMDIAL